MNTRIEQAAVEIHKMITGKIGTKSSRKPIYDAILAAVKDSMHTAAELVNSELTINGIKVSDIKSINMK